MTEPPAPPSNTSIIGLVYDLLPDGATFVPPATLTFTYDPAEIPEGVNEEDLVIAMWDETASKWIELEGCTVDLETHTISAPVSHFTDFTVIAFTSPAAFITDALTVSPKEISSGQEVTIGVTVTNTGDLAGSHLVTLKIDNEVIDSKEVTLAGQTSQEVAFSTTANYDAGDYAISVNGLSGTLTIKEPMMPE